MSYVQTVEFGLGLENWGLGAGSGARLCVLPFRGNGKVTRDARSPNFSVIEVSWSPAVTWRKRIRRSKR